jgi:tetratricopeptide (TPR) repeat protein
MLAASLVLGAVVLCPGNVAATPPAADAPLDSLHTPAEAPAQGNLNISRRLLPDVSSTLLPREAPPGRPPRLDDPDTGQRLFLTARHTVEMEPAAPVSDEIQRARRAMPGDSRIPIWQVMQALRNRDPAAVVWHLPGAVRTALDDPMAAPRLLVQSHQGLVLFVAVFWTLLVAAGLLATWRYLAHDITALLLRDRSHRLRRWTPLLLIAGVLLLRPGWYGALALLSIPLLLQAWTGLRNLLLGTWLLALMLVFPNWTLLREAMPALDPDSNTNLLVRAGHLDASTSLIRELRTQLSEAEDPGRKDRLRIALAHQEARRGRYTASSRLLARRPDDLSALVGRANNSYFLSRFDEALAGYHRARSLAPDRGEIPYNQAQVFFKKLFVPEAGQALEDARLLGFDPPTAVEGHRGASEFSPVVYLGVSREDLRAETRAEIDRYPPLAWLASWNYFLSAPPLPLFVLLAGLLIIALVLTYWGRMQDDIRTCDTCGTEICRGCCEVRDEGWLCHDCAETIGRSRSEMVLATLLKNRSRAIGLATTARLAWFARLVPGSAYLALGQTWRASGRLLLLAVAVFMVTCGWAFDPSATWTSPGLILASETVHPLWWPLPGAAWPGVADWPVVAGWIVLGFAYMLGLVDAARLRQRLPEQFVQDHSGPIAGQGRA